MLCFAGMTFAARELITPNTPSNISNIQMFGSAAQRRPVIRNPHVAAQMRARRAEESRAEHERAIAREFNLSSKASWEQKTNAKIEQRVLREKAQRLRQEAAMQLNARRRRLAAMLDAEQRQFEQEIAASFETPEERRAKCVVGRPGSAAGRAAAQAEGSGALTLFPIRRRMAERARKLQDDRERRRQELLRQLNHQRIRESCDDVRMRDSMHKTLVATKLRQRQIREKEEIKRAEVRGEQEGGCRLGPGRGGAGAEAGAR